MNKSPEFFNKLLSILMSCVNEGQIYTFKNYLLFSFARGLINKKDFKYLENSADNIFDTIRKGNI